jgi:hypothetical protein
VNIIIQTIVGIVCINCGILRIFLKNASTELEKLASRRGLVVRALGNLGVLGLIMPEILIVDVPFLPFTWF